MAASGKSATLTELAELGEWFHNLHLPGGIQTAPRHPLGDFPASKWRGLESCVPADLSGFRVLDIGCNAGYYSFALAARGADVLGIDIDDRYLAQARWAAPRMGLARPPVFRKLSVYGLHELQEDFDLIWFMGVAYHLRHPLLALDIIRSLSPRHLMFQIMTYPDAAAPDLPEDFPLTERERMSAPGWPRLGFIEHRLAGDPTNWWAANATGAEAMLRSSGFAVLARPDPETWWCETAETDPAVHAELRAVMDGRTR